MKFPRLTTVLLLVATAFAAGCGRQAPVSTASAKPPRHEHKPPHGGTPIVLGDEAYHVELVLDAAAGRLQAYVFDGELENFIRSAVPSLEIEAMVDGQPKTIVLTAVGNSATGETAGDTSLFEGQADWLKTTREFDATLKTITVRGTAFAEVKFNFPKGNDKD